MKRMISFLLLFSVLIPVLVSKVYAGGFEEELGSQVSGFYLIGNVASASYQETHSVINTAFMNGTALDQVEIDSRDPFNVSWGIGLGWKFNPWLRADIDFNHFRFHFLSHNYSLMTTGTVMPRLSNFITDSYSNVYFFNGYVNIINIFTRRHYNFNPFIGVGVGASTNQLHHVTWLIGGVPAITATLPEYDKTNFSYQFVLGFVYKVTTHLSLFTRYAYLYLGKYESGPDSVTNQPTKLVIGQVISPPQYNIHINLLGVGLIYLF